ncbi:MAG TPA: ATP-binding protein [Longimicrobiales bacterium]|nr:ATP-binding protein [Longimicrobiales bacterium]
MRPRIQHALFAGFLGVVGLLVVLIVLFVGSGLRRELGADFRAELDRLLALGERIVSSSDGEDPHELARAITGRVGYRVTLIAADGVVIADSFVDPEDIPSVESHATRPEVRDVVADGELVAYAERTSATVGSALLYGARAATLEDQPVVLRIAAPLADIDATVRRIQATVAVTGLFAMLVALVAAYALSVALARPLVELADRARRLADGDFTSTVPRPRVAELGDLAVAFNRLTEELRERLAELGQERDGIQTLIDCMAEGVVALSEDGRVLRTNRTARTMLGIPEGPRLAPVGSVIRHPELREALKDSVHRPEQSREIVLNGKHLLLASRALDRGGSVTTFLDITDIRRMERIRSDFVANASHELKTPLTSIRGYAEALADEPPEDMRRQFLASILSNTLRLQRLVDDLLDLSRLESGGWTAKLESVLVGEVVEEAWELVGTRADHDVDFAIVGEGLVRGDRQGLVQVFRNLLDNAVRHTPGGGRVRVTVRPDGERAHVEIEVVDDGEGIPAQALPRIFERFYRADSSRARHAGGTGLGLAIVKHLLSAMGGEIRADSELGRGTTIRIRLPEASEGEAP